MAVLRLTFLFAIAVLFSPPAFSLTCVKSFSHLVPHASEKLREILNEVETAIGSPIKVLGKGGEGIVLLVEDRAGGNPFVIKIFFQSGDHLYHQRAIQQTLETDFHRKYGNDVPLPFLKTQDLGISGLSFHVVKLERATTDLSAILENFGPAHSQQSLSAILQMADAVRFMHEMGYIHRDLKPGNFFVLPDGRIVLGDFGMAARRGVLTERDRMMISGTDGYRTPEQAKVQAPPSQAMDTYALRVSAMEVLLGRNLNDPRLLVEAKVIKKAGILPHSQSYHAFRASPFTLDPRISQALSAAVWHPSRDVKEFQEIFQTAQKYAGREALFFKEYFGPKVLEPLVESDARAVAREILTSEELTAAWKTGGLGFSRATNRKIKEAVAKIYEEPVNEFSRIGDPLPPLPVKARSPFHPFTILQNLWKGMSGR